MLEVNAKGHKMVTHAEPITLLPITSPIQGKVRVIAATTAAARARRTEEKPKATVAKGSKPVSKPGATTLANELRQVTSILEDYKAQQVTVIPLAGQASFADYLVIATGTSTRHVSSMGTALRDKLGKTSFLGIEGLQDGEWVCADMGSIVVHLFVPEKRVMYNLEKLWSFVFTETTPDPK